MDPLPTKAEAEAIRDILGIPKRIHLSEGQLANLAAHRVPSKKARGPARVEKAEFIPETVVPGMDGYGGSWPQLRVWLWLGTGLHVFAVQRLI